MSEWVTRYNQVHRRTQTKQRLSILTTDAEAAGSSLTNAGSLGGGGEGLMRITLMLTELTKARTLIEGNTQRSLPIYRGFYGNSILIPDNLASGVWIEMAQSSEPPAPINQCLPCQ